MPYYVKLCPVGITITKELFDVVSGSWYDEEHFSTLSRIAKTFGVDEITVFPPNIDGTTIVVPKEVASSCILIMLYSKIKG